MTTPHLLLALLLLTGCTAAGRQSSSPPALLHFWATWCTVCIAEMKDFNAFAEGAIKRGVKVTAVAIEDEETQVKEAAEKLKLTLPIVVDSDDSYKSRYGVRSLPATIAIDQEGRVLEIYDSFKGEWVKTVSGSRAWADEGKASVLVEKLLNGR